MTDLEKELQILLDQNTFWANQHRLKEEAIAEKERILRLLPSVIADMKAELVNIAIKMDETGQRADALLAEIDAAEEAARRHAWHGGNL